MVPEEVGELTGAGEVVRQVSDRQKEGGGDE